ncbi:hypothetical protein Tco_1082456 [Tanacetum coccineum]|uniref:Uncharacterized protein n=1 Tax=Tanacetum coccineum TaxID=301880 RepID=A0ABQ5I1L7_9ASTR
MTPWNLNTRITKRLIWLTIAGLPPQLWYPDSFTNIAEYFGKVILPEDCTHRQFNMSHGKVCILSDRIEFIKETIHIPFGKEIILVRVEEYEGDTDSLFNGYVFDSISEDDESLRTEPVTENHSDSSDEDSNLGGEDPISVEESVTGDESDTQDGFSKNHQVGDSSEHGRDSEKVENTHSWNGFTTFLVEQVNDKSPLCCKVPDNVNVHIPMGFLSTDNHQTLQCLPTRSHKTLSSRALWNTSGFDYAFKKSEGKYGGIIAIWDTTRFLKTSWMEGDGFLAIKEWRKEALLQEQSTMTRLRENLCLIDLKEETSSLSSIDIETRCKIVKELSDLDYSKLKDLRQRAKSRWALEGDENSRFFHGVVNSKRNRSRINGLNIQGAWVTEPSLIKIHIFNTFKQKFHEDSLSRPTFTSNLFKQLSVEECSLLDLPFSTQEIKEAVWSCGGDKAPGPDGFSFKLLKKHWDIFSFDIISYVKEFETKAFIPRGCNSSFINLVPKIKDPL